MLGFHKRTRSLIPVMSLEKYDEKTILVVEDEEEQDVDTEIETPRNLPRQLTLIFVIFFAEA